MCDGENKSVILPVHDAEPWLDECLGSVLQQDFEGSMELSIFNDASKDKSMTIIEKWKKKLEDSGILVVIGGHDSPSPRGVGYSKNQAVAQSSGSYLCFLDANFKKTYALDPEFHSSTGSFRKEYCYQLERICYSFRKQLRNVRSGLEQVEAAAFPGMPPGNFSSTGRRDDASESEAATRSRFATPGKSYDTSLPADLLYPWVLGEPYEAVGAAEEEVGATGFWGLCYDSPVGAAGLLVDHHQLPPGLCSLRTRQQAYISPDSTLNKIIGCQVTREPPNSTERYMRWINQLAPDQLLTQVFTSNGPTVIMPTWFCSRAWFAHVGPFDEGGRGVPEDLLFFYEHLRKGGGVVRVDQSLLLYRYHPGAATHSVLEYVGLGSRRGGGDPSQVSAPRTTIWAHRVRFLEEQALPHWATFTIWNAGRQGRRLYRSLTAGSQRKVAAFCDVDENKIRKGFYCYEDSQERPKPRIPVLHFRAARPPFVICVKLWDAMSRLCKLLLRNSKAVVPTGEVTSWDLTGGVFEDNLRSLNLQEGRDFLHFS
ncbi:hypothetical protein MJG53_015498 [Ovis ammon polii x Ovis aries]|uniref:Uncharacterized protein n=1 Tax=Ovis ammon polii x Ovis aries TaxID=2918886 RepID=A0ACB9UF88_9CETA|nr:hypothetical protein MJG53_015498 [Ovis ammon polii x Ovis aries]